MNDLQKAGRGAEFPRHRPPQPHPVLLQLLDEAEQPPSEAVARPRGAGRATTAGTEAESRPVQRPLYSQD
jgi:hypothetical protein